MRTGRKILLSLVIAGLYSVTGHTRSANSVIDKISDEIEFTLTKTESQSDACKSSRRSAGNKCGQSYIYPVLSHHPNTEVAKKINTFIEQLQPSATSEFSRVESWSEVAFNRQNILSLSYTEQIYGRASFSDQTNRFCSVIDISSGNPIELKDILKQNYQSALPEIIFENIGTSLKHKLPGYMRRLLTEKGSDWLLDPNQQFLIDDRDLSLCFDQGTLSDEAVGPITIALPFELIFGLVDEKGPLAFALDHSHSKETVKLESKEEEIKPLPVVTKVDARSTKEEIRKNIKITDNRIGTLDYICIKEGATHTISIVEYDTSSPFICIVEYDKEYEQKTLWRSRKTKTFCHEKVQKLVKKYETKWNYTCGQSASLSID